LDAAPPEPQRDVVFLSSLLPVGRSSVRVAIGSSIPGIDQAGPGYLAGYSRPVSYSRG
jgi:hypothetical protein